MQSYLNEFCGAVAPSPSLSRVNIALTQPFVAHFISAEGSGNKFTLSGGELQETEGPIDLLLLPPTRQHKLSFALGIEFQW